MANESLEAIRVARTWLNSRQPYLSMALYSMVLVESRSVPYVGVDRWWRCYWNPDTMRKMPVEMQGSILWHEVWHLLREHALRAESVGIACDGKVVDGLLCELWNYGTDAEINDDAKHEDDINLPEWVIYQKDLGCEDGETAEFYYSAQLKSMKAPPPSTTGGKMGGSSPPVVGPDNAPAPKSGRSPSARIEMDAQGAGGHSEGGKTGAGSSAGNTGMRSFGSASDGVTRSWEKVQDDTTHPGLSSSEAKLIARDVAGQILERSKSRGNTPSGAVRWAQEILTPPKVRWSDEVLTIMRGRCAHVRGCWDYTYSRPSRRQGMSRDIVLPSMYRPKPQVAAIIDTSGSMSDLQTGVAVAELSSLIQRLGIPVHVLSVDAAIHHAVQAFGRVDKKLYGGGGTDMALGIREAVKMRPRPNLIVVFTDGLTGWPAENPGVPVVVVLITDDVISTPEWARTIRVHPSEFVAKETVRFRREGER